jgi:hypothetical protein
LNFFLSKLTPWVNICWDLRTRLWHHGTTRTLSLGVKTFVGASMYLSVTAALAQW